MSDDDHHEHDWYWYMKTHDRGSLYWVVIYRCTGCSETKQSLQDWEEL